MSAAGPQPAVEGRSISSDTSAVVGHLLHALNQPLTGLHCSLELALVASRSPEYYVRVLREGLQLSARMRLLVEALRELVDTRRAEAAKLEVVQLEALLADIVEEIEPLAETRHTALRLTAGSPVPVRADRGRLTETCFRFLEAIVSLSEKNSTVQLMAAAERDHAAIIVSCTLAAAPQHSPFSRAELGLLLARASWEQVGGSWTEVQDRRTDHGTRLFTLRFPLGASAGKSGGSK